MATEMDLSKIYMVQSVKGCDMLCVDNYLFHFDMCLKETFNWVCSKRKYQVACKCRITTVTEDGDLNKHVVKKVYSEHTHERCDPELISEALERKHFALAIGKPSTLESKVLKRKIKLEEESIRKKRILYESPVLDLENRSKLYMLRTNRGKLLVSYGGYLFSLFGKSVNTSKYRWNCIHSKSVGCKTYIITEAISENDHIFNFSSNQLHQGHNPFTPEKLRKFCEIQNLEVLNSDVTEPVKQKQIFEIIVYDEDSEERGINIENEENVLDKNSPTYINIPNESSRTSNFVKSIEGGISNYGEIDDKRLFYNNYTYELQTINIPKSNNVYYWSCAMSQNNAIKCKARVTTSTRNNGLQTVHLIGEHIHPPKLGERYRKFQIESNSMSSNLMNLGKKTLQNTKGILNKDLRNAMVKSKETIQRGFHRFNERVKDRGYTKISSAISESSLSSISDDLDTDLELETTELPTSISSMRKKINKEERMPEQQICIASNLPPKSFSDATILETEGELEEVEDGLGIEVYQNIEEPSDNVEIIEEYLECPEENENPSTSQDSSTLKNILERDEDVSNESLDTSFSSLDDFFTVLPFNKKFTRPSAANAPGQSNNFINTTKVFVLKSAKGEDLLSVDGYIYHMKNSFGERTYWGCVEHRDQVLQCKAQCTTIKDGKRVKVLKLSNCHSHKVKDKTKCEILDTNNPSFENEIKEGDTLIAKSAEVLNDEYNNLVNKIIQLTDDECEEEGSTMKLYAVSDGPPSLAVRMALKALNIPFDLVNVDYVALEHMTEEYAKMNPQKEIPVLDDNGFYLPESVAIMQYLCDKYGANSTLYPKDPTKRALVNHRLCFNMGFYYSSIGAHSMAPIFFDYKRAEMSLKKVRNALQVFEIYLKRSKTKYAASDHLTIADFALVSATLCLEAIGFDLSPWPLVKKWYETFKIEYPELWEIANGGMQEIKEFEKNPPDLSHMNHPFHPIRKNKA